MTRAFMAAAILVCLSASSAMAITSYTQPVTNSTSVTINGTTHQIGAADIGVIVRNSSGVIQPTTAYSYSINTTNFNVTVNWTSSFSGSVELKGPFNTDTTNLDDFECQATTPSNPTLQVCPNCTFSNYAARSYNSKRHVALGPSTLEVVGSSQLRVYMLDNKLVYGFSAFQGWVSAACTGGNCEVQYNIPAFPSGSTPLCKIGINNNGWIPASLIDYRPW